MIIGARVIATKIDSRWKILGLGRALRTSRLGMREERRVKDYSLQMQGWNVQQLSRGRLWLWTLF